MRTKLSVASGLTALLILSTAPMMVPVRVSAMAPPSMFDRFTAKDVTIPAGTRLPVVLDTGVASNASRIEQPVSGHVTRDVVVDGAVVVPAGSEVRGVVTDARRSGKVKGLAHVAIRFTSFVPKGSTEAYRISSAAIGRTAQATKRKDAVKIGAPAAGGALVGALVGGKKGALIGAGIGGGAGTAVVLTTRGKEVGMARGTALSVRLSAPVTVHVRS